MSKFKKVETGIKDLVLIEPTVFQDQRGFFMESYSKKDFLEIGLHMEFVQDNHSKSKKRVLRGLHFQSKHSQGKLVRVIRGSVWDVAVDLREKSSSFGKWYGVLLSEEKKMLYIPEGFAHGFLTLEHNTESQYKCTNSYYNEYDAGLKWDDPDIGIEWPFKKFRLEKEEILLSEKDIKQPRFKEYFKDIL